MDKMTLSRMRQTYTEKQYISKLDAAIKQHPRSFEDRNVAYQEAFLWLTAKFAKRSSRTLVTPEFYQGAAKLYGIFINKLPQLIFSEQESDNGLNR